MSFFAQYLAVCLTDTCGFKQSTQKRDETLQFIPCNLHLQRMRVQSLGNGVFEGVRVYMGCTLKILAIQCTVNDTGYTSGSSGESKAVETRAD